MPTKLPKGEGAEEAAGLELALEALPREGRLLVGVSGGVDSTVLLAAMVRRGFKRMTVVHLDHGLRGAAARGDARFVEGLGRKWKLPVLTERADVGALARDGKMSIETAARHARYAFFAKAARRTRCKRIVLAHHADDQAETFLFNLLRGGGSGLGGMRARTMREVEGVKLEILRPWLGVWRSEIEEYAAREKIRFREDASNASPEHTRNRLRTRVLPMLTEEFGRDVRQSLWRAAEVLGAQQEWLEASVGAQGEELSVEAMRALPEALQRHAIHGWLRRAGTPQVSFALVESVRGMLPVGAKVAKVNLPGGKFARRRGGRVFVERGRTNSRQALRV